METVNYYPRICDQVLNRKLQLTGATLIVGPKWCGKTETALQAVRSVIYIQSDPQYKETGKIMPSLLLEGETPRLIDEWQEVPELWNAETGEIRSISQWLMEDGHISVPLKFGPAESYFIVFRETGKPNDSSSPNFPNYSDVRSIEGNWNVQLRGQADSTLTIKLDKLTSLHLSPNPKVKYFSGTAIYRNTFQLDQINDDRIFIDLGDVANLVEIYINGEKVSVLWKPPFKSEITDKLKIGQNYLEIRVSTTWRNRLVGEVLTNSEDIANNLPNYPIQRLRGLTLLKSGLLGPVKIQKILKQK